MNTPWHNENFLDDEDASLPDDSDDELLDDLELDADDEELIRQIVAPLNGVQRGA